MGYLSKSPRLKVKTSSSKMKAALLLFGVLVCATMTEASSVRRAKNHVKAILKRHHTSSTAAPTTTARDVFDYDYDTGCGDTCDLEFDLAVQTCNQEHLPDGYAWVACAVSFFDPDCSDCLCDYIYTMSGGLSCPSY